MYKFILGILFVFVGHSIYAQHSSDVGVVAGACYYLGDINPENQFYSSSPMVGLMFRYNMGSRYSLRTSLSFADLEANDLDFDNEYQQERKASFTTELVDFSVQLEFNFQPFSLPLSSRTKRFSPYVTSGLSYISSSSTTSSFAIPMGIGCKYIIAKRWTVAVEWSFKKTFTDDLDDLNNPYSAGITRKLYNDDWISFLGVSLTLQLFNNLQCHAYDRIVK